MKRAFFPLGRSREQMVWWSCMLCCIMLCSRDCAQQINFIYLILIELSAMGPGNLPKVRINKIVLLLFFGQFKFCSTENLRSTEMTHPTDLSPSNATTPACKGFRRNRKRQSNHSKWDPVRCEERFPTWFSINFLVSFHFDAFWFSVSFDTKQIYFMRFY